MIRFNLGDVARVTALAQRLGNRKVETMGESTVPPDGDPVTPKRRWTDIFFPLADKFIRIVVYVGLVVVAVSLAAPGINCRGDRGARRPECLNNMRQIGLAMHNYAARNQGYFPPQYRADKAGRPLLSWRVLLLPLLEQEELFKEFHLDEPWDSPHNKKLIGRIPKVYRCPSNPSNPESTCFTVISGKGMVFDGTNQMLVDDVARGDSTTLTLLLVEVAESGIPWTQPRDLPFESMNFHIGADRQGFSSYHAQGANVIFCDGHGRFMSTANEPDIVRALCTPRGGEKLGDDF